MSQAYEDAVSGMQPRTGQVRLKNLILMEENEELNQNAHNRSSKSIKPIKSRFYFAISCQHVKNAI